MMEIKIERNGRGNLWFMCQRWRTLVFESPRRLNLQLCCTPKTPAKDALDIWPALPLMIVRNNTADSGPRQLGTDNLIAALGHSNRVCQVDMDFVRSSWQSGDVLAAMHVPFPELTDLQLWSYLTSVIPDSFLGGSAPRLRYVDLNGIPFPGLPKLLLSATHLVYLSLRNIPQTGYISPDAMVALLPVLSSLEVLELEFQFPQSRPDLGSRSLPPLKQSILPSLHVFRFEGVTGYLENFVTFIDAPQLNCFDISFFTQTNFDTARLSQFINRTPRLRALDEAHVQFDHTTSASVEVLARSGTFNISFPCIGPDRQLRSMGQVCNSSLHPLSTVEDLYIESQYSRIVWKNESTLWLELLLLFTAVKNLYLSKECAPVIAAALQELVGGRITEELLSLQNIFVEGHEPSGPFQENIGRFVAARQLSDHPVTISVWRNYPVNQW